MIYHCPICGEWCKCDNHGSVDDYCFQSDSQGGFENQTIIEECIGLPLKEILLAAPQYSLLYQLPVTKYRFSPLTSIARHTKEIKAP